VQVLVPVTNAIVGIDLADRKQMVVVTDHDSKVGVSDVPVPGVGSGDSVGLGRVQARSSGLANVTVACEPTGHR